MSDDRSAGIQQEGAVAEAPAPAGPGEAAEGAEARGEAGSEQTPDSFLLTLVEHTVPEQADASLRKLLGASIAPAEETGNYDVSVAGRFSGDHTVELLTYLKEHKRSGALVVAERDEERVLHFSLGALVGAASTVLFESLGRILYQAGVVKHEDSHALVDGEEQRGPQSLLLWISSAHLAWACERRVWEVAAAITLIKRGHFLFVEGEPVLEGPTVYLDPTEVAEEGRRRKDAWRSGTADSGETYRPPSMGAPPPPITRRLRPIEIGEDALAVLLTRIQEAEAGPT